MFRCILPLFLLFAGFLQADVPLQYAFSSNKEAVFISLKLPEDMEFDETYMTAFREKGPLFQVVANVRDGLCVVNDDNYTLLDMQITVEVINNDLPKTLNFLMTVKSSYEGINHDGELEILRDTAYIDGTTTSLENDLRVNTTMRPEFIVEDHALNLGELIFLK